MPTQAPPTPAKPSQTTAEKWTMADLQALYDLPFFDLMVQAQQVHRENFDPHQVQHSTLLSIKTGKCPEDCSYCPQSAHFNTGLETEPLMPMDEVMTAAKAAKAQGATRFCMGAAWRGPNQGQLEQVKDMVAGVKAMGLETCVTLGLLEDGQAEQLKEAGLDYYNHNLDTSEEFYKEIITTRTYDDRLTTLNKVRDAGINVCCGGILGLGESDTDRLEMVHTLANLAEPPESVPLNLLMPIEGTPLADNQKVDPFEFIRLVAVARISMPKSMVRLSAGRETMDDTWQAWCFFAGANSIFYGDTLLTADNPQPEMDKALMDRLNITSMPA